MVTDSNSVTIPADARWLCDSGTTNVWKNVTFLTARQTVAMDACSAQPLPLAKNAKNLLGNESLSASTM